MGTLDDAEAGLKEARRTRDRGLAAAALGAAHRYQADLIRLSAKPHLAKAYAEEIDDLANVIHDLAREVPDQDPDSVWRGRTRQGLRVQVVRRAQLAVGRRGRGRVEDGFVVLIDGKTATPTIPRAAAMKQARWATILVGGEFIPIYETMTGRQLARRRRAKRRDRPATLSEWRRWLGSPYRKHGARIGPDRRVVRT